MVDNRAAQSLTNYQVKVSLPAGFDFSNIAAGGNDIRFTDSDGTTTLNYWKEALDSNGRTGDFWVNIPVLSGQSSKVIYLYYGNPAASSQSNGRATFPFFDDFATSAWTSVPDMPIATADASAAAVNGKFYIIGGYGSTPNNPQVANYEFDPQTNTYSRKTPMPTPRWGAIAVGVGRMAYVFGGSLFSEATPVATTEVYDAQSDSWTARRPAPKSLATEGVTGCTDGVDVFLFANGEGYRYHVRTDSYSLLAGMPHYVGNWASCGYYRGKIFVVGGLSHDRDVERSTEIYDIKTNHWTTGRPMPFASYGSVRENPVVGDTMYILQGQREYGEFSSAAYAYNLASNSWSDRSFGPHAEDGAAGGVSNGKIFTFGGRQDLSGPYGLTYASVYDPKADHGSAWRQMGGGFEMSGGELRTIVPPRGSDYSAKAHGSRLARLATRKFQTSGDFVLEARMNQASVDASGDVSGVSWNSIGVETNADEDASRLVGCRIPFNDYGTTPSRTGIMAVRGSALESLASVSPATMGVVAYGVARSRDDLLLTENGRPVVHASDRSCRSGKGFVSILAARGTGSSWSSLFVRTYTAIEPRVEFPAGVG